jgi:hypothetical protein
VDGGTWDDDAPFGGRPLPPDDRLWRHPSELGGYRLAPPPARHWSAWWTVGLLMVGVGVSAVVVQRLRSSSVNPVQAAATVVPSSPPTTAERLTALASPVITVADTVLDVVVETSTSAPPAPTSAAPTAAAPGAISVSWNDGTVRGAVAFAPSTVLTIGWADTGAPVLVTIGADTWAGRWIGGDESTGLGLVDVPGASLDVPARATATASVTDLMAMERGLAAVVNDRRVDHLVAFPGTATIGEPVWQDGQLIGVTIAEGPEETKLVAPIELSAALLDRLLDAGVLERPWWGITVSRAPIEPSSDPVAVLTDRIVISELDSTGPAAAAGLQLGDVIERIDGRIVAHPSDVVLCIRAAGTTVNLDVRRGDTTMTVTMVATFKPVAPPASVVAMSAPSTTLP